MLLIKILVYIIAIIASLALTCMFGTVGFGCIHDSLQALWRGTQSKRWTATQAEAAGFRVHVHTDGYSPETYYYTISYRYSVDGVAYQAAGYPSDHFSSYAVAEAAAVTESSLKKPLTVFYYPKKPKIYVLARGISGISMLGIALKSLFGIFLLLTSLQYFLAVLSLLLAIFLIGMPPELGCPTPDFSERRWIPSECPDI